ncbi:uncharacterized protein LOC119349888 [Triticum dicoccoides]|uniref:uncharacterized protein LOC119349888 n=1 Tax=Triticum dicoccoides TaxID=85692 RepID=UPI0018904320|nr:uncharacterized protein LOC119349888 [Triticum dicoccoides]
MRGCVPGGSDVWSSSGGAGWAVAGAAAALAVDGSTVPWQVGCGAGWRIPASARLAFPIFRFGADEPGTRACSAWKFDDGICTTDPQQCRWYNNPADNIAGLSSDLRCKSRVMSIVRPRQLQVHRPHNELL